ncbi:MFS transporter [Terriglobus albidus]|uniref:MFS transporter n=1 Tax=Terriglobus albidus TaxID=1592106 RepID=A0A5B9EEN6_9BACT|nr:MFS transporter [Terriglobus albidus]QEE28881.1 MFS transporter [Terriglobus albidus]
MTSQATNSPETTPVLTVHPYLGVAGVLLGAMIATCTGRLMSVGLADIRGALHLGFDEGSWINTSFNASMMFIGPFSVYLGGLLGPRRVLLACASIFTAASFLIPFSHSLPIVIGLLIVAGLTAGTFYPLTLSFVLRNLPMQFVLLGIAMYATDIIFTTDMAQAWESFFIEHLSWRWIFWNGTILTPLMMVLIHFGIPWQPLPKPQAGHPAPSFRGFLYASLGAALLYVALDQGQRLDWFHSSLILALTITGVFLVLAAVVRHFLLPNPLINYQFLLRRNTLLLALVLISFRFVMLATVVSIPSFLGSVRGFLPLQEAPVLLWVAVPQFILGIAAMALMRRVDPRLILTAGFSLVAIACLMNSRVTSVWAGANFGMSQAAMAIGLALAFNAMVGSIVLEVLNSGALTRPADVLTFAGFFQITRLFGGEMGAALMGHFIPIREQFHSNMLGMKIQLGNTLTDYRLLGLRGAFAHHSTGATATGRAAEVLALQVRQQAFTLAISDSFVLVATCCVACLIVVAFMSTVPTQYGEIIASSVKAK